jgi:TonB family protein
MPKPNRTVPPNPVATPDPYVQPSDVKQNSVVLVGLEVEADGLASDVVVLSTDSAAYARAALAAVRAWRFVPPALDGNPTRAAAEAEVSFHFSN